MRENAMRWLGLPIFLVVLFALVAACGGGDSDNENENDDSGGSSEDNSDGGDSNDGGSGSDNDGDADDPDSPTDDGGSGTDDGDDDGGSSDDGGGSTGSGGDAGSGLEILRQTADGLNSEAFHVVYDVTSDDINGEFTFSSSPPNSLMGINGTFEGMEANFMIITLDDALYFCADSEGDQQCLKLAPDNLAGIPFELPTTFQADDVLGDVLDQPGVSAAPAGSRTIAGIDADCFEVDSTDTEDALFCVGENKILYMESTIEGQRFQMEAKEVEADAGSISIEVPDWPVTDLSNFGN